MLLDLYNKSKGRNVPEIGIFSSKRTKVIPFVQKNGGKIIYIKAIQPEQPFFTHVVGLTDVVYAVTKE
jgi:hypothetical protein